MNNITLNGLSRLLFPPNIFCELLHTDLPVFVGVNQAEQRGSLLLTGLDSHEFQYLQKYGDENLLGIELKLYLEPLFHRQISSLIFVKHIKHFLGRRFLLLPKILLELK